MPPHAGTAHVEALCSDLAWRFSRPARNGLEDLRAAYKPGRCPFVDVELHDDDTIWAAAKIWAAILEKDSEYQALMHEYLTDPFFDLQSSRCKAESTHLRVTRLIRTLAAHDSANPLTSAHAGCSDGLSSTQGPQL